MSRRSHSRARSKEKKRRAHRLAVKRRAFTETRRNRKKRRPYVGAPLPEAWPW